ncbi:hypothetical protein [Streptomyces gilvosporeus]|uniref:Uncharacterized protein n=1 Tax=Streptomyces gilvosporeus TaxID=553510 RepID=A0A1V0U012_9ACTN|nr:hypothetical protein [Streptomyces gilvosporeus]ARF58559.1 hypothetical protein B1H19_34105 [Streptomyces gilvosporeus]
MPFIGEVWRVERGAEVVGEITVTEANFPWLNGRFAPGPGYPELRPHFVRELELVEAVDEGMDDMTAWEDAYNRACEGVRLVAPTGPVAEFLLHIEDDAAWFRWNEEPFPKDLADGAV